ncbi:MAG: autotransporter assembly complex protein TamA, partial [Paracoccaceae bacterium]
AFAFDSVTFSITNADEDLTKDLRRASALLATQNEGDTTAQDLFAAARGEYSRLVGALYAKGYYAPVISVEINGQEAATIAPLDAPSTINTVTVTVDPGPRFAFSRAAITPLAQGTVLPPEFRTGRIAESALIQQAVDAGVDGWRDLGHAKAAPSGQTIVADHTDATLSAEVSLDPGPRLRFGPLTVTGLDRMSERRTRKIAGLPEGQVFSPEELDRAADRLRRTGVFRSVVLSEDDQVIAPDLVGITAELTEEKPKRYSIGAEVASFEGLTLSGYWLHRNLLGGAERFTIDTEITNIGAQNSGVDYSLGVTLDRPATLTADTTLGLNAEIARVDEDDYRANSGTIGFSFSHIFSNDLTGRIGLQYDYLNGSDDVGTFLYRNLGLPIGATWDKRDNRTDAKRGFYLDGEIKPFLGFGTTDSGARLAVDARVYRSFGAENRVTFAARAQLGAIYGASLIGTPRDDLFYSGGGGTVRGQPYQSLGVNVLRSGNTFSTGGTRFVATSVEARVRVTPTIGIVGFVDAGSVGVTGFADASSDWHAGAGLGLRYATGFGPIRLDVAAPVRGNTGDGVQVYVGIGQSF